MPYWLQALLIGGGGLLAYLVLLKRLRRTHRPKDLPDIVIKRDEPGQTDDDRG